MERRDFMAEFFLRKKNTLNPSDFDAFVLQDINKSTTRAKTLLGVDDFFVNEFNPIVVSTPAAATKTVEPYLVYGEDKLRYDLADFNALFFGKNFMFSHSCTIDHKTGALFNDRTVEIPYSKIKTIETSSRFDLIDKMEHHIFEVKIILDNLDDIIIPLRILLVDAKTDQDEYLIPKGLLELSSNLKAFLRTKMN